MNNKFFLSMMPTEAVVEGAALYLWGYNAITGNIGDGTTINKSSPVKIGALRWKQISTSWQNSAAIRSDGLLFAWGYGPYLGYTGDTTSWAQLALGTSHVAAIRSDGSLYTWGNNAAGQLGDGSISAKLSPVKIGSSSWTQVSAGSSHTAAIRSDYKLFAWGLNSNGQLGDGTTLDRASPVIVGTLGDGISWTQVSAGGAYTAAIRSDGSLFAWGNNSDGQLGNGTTITRSSPVIVGALGDGISWAQVSAGGSHAAAIRSDYKLFAWGNNGWGPLGDGTAITRSSPVQIGSSSWTQVSAGNSHTAAIRSDYALFTWGNNLRGHLGDGTAITRSSPVIVGAIGDGISWTQVSANNTHTAAIRSDGSLFAWGFNNFGQLGDGTTINRSSPVKIGSSSWTQVSVGQASNLGAGGSAIVGITSDKKAHGWGVITFLNAPNQFTVAPVGLLDIVNTSSPVQIGSSSWTQVSVGVSYTAAIRSDGLLFTWGGNTNFTLGSNDSFWRASPTQIGSSSWTQVSAGGSHTAAIRSDYKLFTWGNNGSGRLGDGTVATRSSPVIVGTLGDGISWTQVSASNGHTAAIRSDGSLFAWGVNTSGQRGDGTTTLGSSPVKIGSSSWTQVSAGSSSTAAIRSDGILFTWGYNNTGMLGDGTVINKSSPVQIGSSSWTQVSVGQVYMAAIRSDGLLFAWGSNSNGQLGDASTVPKSSPVQIGSSSWTQVNAGAQPGAGSSATTGAIAAE